MSEFDRIDDSKTAEAEKREADEEAGKAPIRERLVKQYEGIHGEVTDAARLLLDKAAYLDLLADEAGRELNDRGLRESYAISTYRTGSRENKSLEMLLKIQTQQAKLLRELRLLPGGRKSAADEADDVLTQILTYVLTLQTYLCLEIGHEKESRIPSGRRDSSFTPFILHSEFRISHFVYSPSCLLRLENAFVSPSSTKPLSVSPI